MMKGLKEIDSSLICASGDGVAKTACRGDSGGNTSTVIE